MIDWNNNLNNIYRWERLPHNNPNNKHAAYLQARFTLMFRRGYRGLYMGAKPKGYLP